MAIIIFYSFSSGTDCRCNLNPALKGLIFKGDKTDIILCCVNIINIFFVFTEQTQRELQQVKEEKDKMNKEKDQEIGDLRLKIDSMGRDYERVLNVRSSSSVFRPE